MDTCLVVADDLTGAMDTGHQFAARGYSTGVQIGPGVEDVADGVAVRAVDTESRYSDSGTAANAVESVVERHPTAVIYKKIDSTLRGNLVPEIDATIAASDPELVVVAPAFPANGRITVDGYHLVDGTPVTDTEHADDEKAVSSAHVPTALSSSNYPVDAISVGEIERGLTALEDALARQREEETPRIVVCDAVEDRHLVTIATAAYRSDADVAYVGSAGLAKQVHLDASDGSDSQLAEIGGLEDEDGKDETEVAAGPLGIVGSVNATTLDQLTALPEEVVTIVDADRIVSSPEKAGADAATRAIGVLEDRGRAVVTAATSREDVEETVAAGEREGLSPGEVRTNVADALAASAIEVHAEGRTSGLFVTGGDVATAVLDRFEATLIRLSGREVEPGIPRGRVEGGIADGLPIVTKAGGFGDRRTIDNCLDSLEGNDD